MFPRIISLVSISLSLTAPAAAAVIDLGLLGAEASETASGVEVVEVRVTKRGHLLALVPIGVPMSARASASGEVELLLPWYAYLSVTHREELLTKLRAAVDNARHYKALGSVRAAGIALSPSFTAEEALEVEKRMRSVLEED